MSQSNEEEKKHFILLNNQEQGPYSLTELRVMVWTCVLPPSTLCACAGMSEWIRLDSLIPVQGDSATPSLPVLPAISPQFSSRTKIASEKSAPLAFVLALIGGPLGFFYLGWRSGVAAVCLFVVYVVTMLVLALIGALPTAVVDRFSFVWSVLHGLVLGVAAATAAAGYNASVKAGGAAVYEKTRSGEAPLYGYQALLVITFLLLGLGLGVKLVSEGRIFAAIFAGLFFGPLTASLGAWFFMLIGWILAILASVIGRALGFSDA